ncbi:replication initiation protein [Cetobacterium somerae]|uniref:replication initiation protein n=1 Tax=Cetobacterium somerae TaxID=188913 RepID=UPI00211EE665|nr:replication initiation protein [Cetobacterium somerae]MCQ9627825.1 replication initiation protein [Cetobacterium somerae]
MSEKHEMVEYSKDIATSINEFSAYELDIFLVIVFVSRNILKHDEVSELENLKLELPVSMVKKLLSGTHNSRIKKALDNIFDTKVYLKNDRYTEVRHMFERLYYSDDYKNIFFELKKDYIKLFYNLTGNFTQHKIKEFTSLRSRYAKRIYQLIMSYKGLYKWEFEAKEFRKILDIPDSYSWPDLDIKIIKKVSKELEESTNIKNITIDKIKNGRVIETIVLKWIFKTPEVLEENDGEEEVKVIENSTDNDDELKERRKLSEESEIMMRAFDSFNDTIKQVMLEKAMNYFLKELGKDTMDGYTKKIWDSIKNIYIVKAMKGEI